MALETCFSSWDATGIGLVCKSSRGGDVQPMYQRLKHKVTSLWPEENHIEATCRSMAKEQREEGGRAPAAPVSCRSAAVCCVALR